MSSKTINTNLTNDKRDILRNLILSHAFDQRKKTLQAQAHALAKDAIKHRLGDKDWRLYSSIPDNWLRSDICVMVRVAGRNISLDVGERVRLPSFMYGNYIATFDRSDALGERIETHDDAAKELKRERDTQDLQIKKVLYSCRTVKQLLDVWPEIEAFIPKEWAERKTDNTLPAVVITDLNVKLGLPPETKAA